MALTHGENNRPANRLMREKSPYLLQHAFNPVDWYPWEDEAFEKAKHEDKPIFLSIGYSTCHWCHVMEKESFEDEEVARVLNRVFVCIKVDREERPDIDSIYMTACQAMTGSGGWPLSILMTPEKRPFFAATYLPKRSHSGRMGLLELTARVETLWQSAREEINRAAEQVLAGLQTANSIEPGEGLSAELLDLAYARLAARYDADCGGFGQSPKFPTPHNLTFLLRYWQRTGKKEALKMAEHSLTQISRGGIRDHIGFGFHRYATDREWLLPHFEKMLYDQALLGIAFLEAYQATGRSSFADTAKEIFTYVLRDMTSQEGGFYSAEDADSEGEEGKFYVWSSVEIAAVLGEEDAAFFCKVYNIRREGNFFDEATRRLTGKNIPHLTATLPSEVGTPVAEQREPGNRLAEILKKLYQARSNRVPPYKDDKVLTDWNGLMIAALSIGGRVLGDGSFTAAAIKAAEFVLARLKK
ncbi:MAG TPA: thioredoxin domain-containing protein, partial [Firmicutes bacterium]|nr:thioredoxin domain-containing protein [Bacillota bacterium]